MTQAGEGRPEDGSPSPAPRYGLAFRTSLLLAAPALLWGCQRSARDPFQESDFSRYWSGSFHILGDSVEVVLDLAPDGPESTSARVSLPAQGLFDVPVDAERAERRLEFRLASLGARYNGRLTRDRASIRGDWYQAGGKFRLTLRSTSAPPEPHRPQEPTPPLPYHTEEVRISHAHGLVVLAGTLTLPEGEGPFPATVLVSGSGPQDRDETLFGHRPFRVLADHLTRAGVAVLRYDDRGVAASTGDFAAATTEDFAADALAAVDYLADREEVDPERVGIIGHSEGGIVAPMAAARSHRVAFIVSLAGTGISGRELLELQTRLILEASEIPEPVIALNRRIQDELFDALMEGGSPEGAAEIARQEMEAAWGGLPFAAASALGLAAQFNRALEEQMRQVASPWLFFFLTFDPATAFEQVQVPVLALNGSLDLQVPPGPNLRLIREAVKRGGNENVTTIELEGLNHLFQRANTGLPAEYGRIRETMAPEVLRIVTDWILSLEPAPPPRRQAP